MQEKWILDGFNLIHGLASKNKRPSPKDFSCELASFAAFNKIEVLLVLDGVGNAGELESLKTNFFEAVYSGSVTADAFIERYIFQNKHQYKLVVVTQDAAILQIAKGSGSQTMRLEEFKTQMRQWKSELNNAEHELRIDSHGFNRPFADKLKNFKLE